jgi:hypothetical protein
VRQAEFAKGLIGLHLKFTTPRIWQAKVAEKNYLEFGKPIVKGSFDSENQTIAKIMT